MNDLYILMSNYNYYSSDRTICPISTAMSLSAQEAVVLGNSTEFEEIKAYKLGKKRWSYNQVHLTVVEKGGNRELHSKQALHSGIACDELGDLGGIKYQITLSNDEVITVHLYLVYDYYQIESSVRPLPNKDGMYDWILVNRADCKRCCEGPTLRAIQRLGKLGKRTGSNCSTPQSCKSGVPRTLSRSNSSMKDSRYMYISLDEAVTHVGCCSFRLVGGAYDASSSLIGTSVSPPIRVLANNDVPTGAAHIEMTLQVDSDWAGWENSFQPVRLEFPPISPMSRDMAKEGSTDSLITPKRLSARLRKAMSSGQKRLSHMLNDMETDDPVHLRRTQSMKKGKVDSGPSKMINLTARSGSADLASPFINLKVEDNVELNSQEDQKPLIAWLEELDKDVEQKYYQEREKQIAEYHTQPHASRVFDHAQAIPGAGAGLDTSRMEDPVAAFIQLMMSQSPPKEHIPIIEIPKPTTRQNPFHEHATGPLDTDAEYMDSLLGGIDSAFDTFIPDGNSGLMSKGNPHIASGEPFLSSEF